MFSLPWATTRPDRTGPSSQVHTLSLTHGHCHQTYFPPSRPDLSSSCLRPSSPFSLLPPTSTSSSSRPPLVVQSFVSRSVFRPERCLYKHPFCALCVVLVAFCRPYPPWRKIHQIKSSSSSRAQICALVRQASPRRDHLPCRASSIFGPIQVQNYTDRDAYELGLAQFHRDPIHVVRLLRFSTRPRAVVSEPAHSTARTTFATYPPRLTVSTRLELAQTHPRAAVFRTDSISPQQESRRLLPSRPTYPRRSVSVHLSATPVVESSITFNLVPRAADCLICCPTAKVSLSIV